MHLWGGRIESMMDYRAQFSVVCLSLGSLFKGKSNFQANLTIGTVVAWVVLIRLLCIPPDIRAVGLS